MMLKRFGCFKAPIRCYSSGSADLLKTPLYDIHVQLGGKMVPYAGYAMPVLYKDQSHIESHNWVRSKAGLFDVSHMLQHKFSGPGASDFLEYITPSDLKNLEVNHSTLSVLLNDIGGINDDCIITKHGEDEFYVVTNAGCRSSDLAFIADEIAKFPRSNEVKHSTFEGTLLALQGPKASELLQKFTTTDLSKLVFGTSAFLPFDGLVKNKIHTARSGYTGEDGFEISIPNTQEALEFTKTLLDIPDIKPIGLAARDSLRLEAGMCLYGNDINQLTTPVEASLTWVVGKSRREAGNSNFLGSSNILEQIKNKDLVKSVRVGLVSRGPSPRSGDKIFNENKEEVGHITSGAPSPTLGGNVAQGYIEKKYRKSGTKLFIQIRGKLREAETAKMPFVPAKFHRA